MKAMVTYRRPTNWKKANNYKHLASAKTKKQMENVWRSCKHCTLCDYHGKHNYNKSMVPCVSQIMTKIHISRWTKTWHVQTMVFTVCSDFLKCHQQYDGQTVNKFSTGWSSHPSSWNKPDIRDDSE